MVLILLALSFMDAKLTTNFSNPFSMSAGTGSLVKQDIGSEVIMKENVGMYR